MDEVIIVPPDTDFSFTSIDDFKDCMSRGGEVNFDYNKKEYFVGLIDVKEWEISRTNYRSKDGNYYKYDDGKILTPNDFQSFSSVEELLDYEIDGKPLRSIVTKLEVWDRTI